MTHHLSTFSRSEDSEQPKNGPKLVLFALQHIWTAKLKKASASVLSKQGGGSVLQDPLMSSCWDTQAGRPLFLVC